MIIRLTEKGKTESEEMVVDNDDTEDLFQCLTDEEQKNLIAYLERLIQAWQIGDGMDRRRMGRRRAEAFRTAQRSDDERMGFGFQHFDESEPFKGILMTGEISRRDRGGKMSIFMGFANMCLFIVYFIIGTAGNSISVISEGVDNLMDACSSLLLLLGFQISGREKRQQTSQWTWQDRVCDRIADL